MLLRTLKKKDAPLMLEWMHDETVTGDLGTDFSLKTEEDCIRFINESQKNKGSINLAIADEEDQYMGTVSLKHINLDRGDAEFAIAMRKCAMGLGYSKFGMAKVLSIGFEKLKLNAIYWCVNQNNKRAVRFYDKNKYPRINRAPEYIMQYYPAEQLDKLFWYCKKKEKL